MGRVTRPRLNEVSLAQLSELLGERTDTIKRKLFEIPPVAMARRGHRAVFPSRAALERLLLGNEVMSPAQERARRDRADAELKELELKVRRGELIATDQPRRAIISLASMTSARLQGIPSAIARELAAESKPAVCEAVVRREIWRALEDLADSADRAEAKLQKEEAAADSGSP